MNSPSSLRLLRITAVIERAGLKRTAIYGRIKSGDFPKPIKIGSASRWIEHEI